MAYDLQLGQSSRHVSGQYAYLLVSGDTVYYGNDVSVSASYNLGSLTPGQYLDQPGPAYLVSAGTSYIRQVDRATVSDASIIRPPDGGVPAYDATDRSFKFQSGNSVLNVKDFGAAGDGTTDDTAAIHAAMSSRWTGVLETDNRSVFFPPGVYMVTGLTVPTSRMTLVGATAGSFGEGALFSRSCIKLIDGSDTHVLSMPTIARSCTIDSIMIDGNGTEQSAGCHGIYMENGTDGNGNCQNTITNCYITRTTGNGIHVGTNRSGNYVVNTNIYDCGVNGIELDYSDNKITNNAIGNCTSHGIKVNSGGWTNKIIGNDIWDCETGVFLGPSSKNNAVIGNMFDRHQTSGVYSIGTCHTISGNSFHSNSCLTDATYAHISINDTDNTVSGNTFSWYSNVSYPNKVSTDVYLGPGALECTVVGNKTDGNNTYGFIGINAAATAFIDEGVRRVEDKVTTVASAATIALDNSSRVFNVTGTTTITSVTASWAGRIAILKFAGSLTFTDGSNLKLAGDFVTTADATITLFCDGTNWYETGRSVN